MAWRGAAAAVVVNAYAVSRFQESTYHSLQFKFASRLSQHQDTFNLSDWLFRPRHPNQIIDLNQSFSRSRAPLDSSRFLGVVHSSSDLMANGNSRSSAKVRVHRVRARCCMLHFPPRENACACMPRYICVGNCALRNFPSVITPRPQRIDVNLSSMMSSSKGFSRKRVKDFKRLVHRPPAFRAL